MAVNHNFRSSLSGFNRGDVVRYIDYMNTKHAEQISELNAETEQLREQLQQSASAPEQQTRVAELENQLAYYRGLENSMATDTLSMANIDSLYIDQLSQYSYVPARVVANTINRNRNFITLNRGREHGITEDMAVITPDGSLVGVVKGCSNNYSVVVSILNERFNTSGKISGDEHYGSITWNGRSPHKVQLSEITKYAEFEVGAPVVSAGLSHIFPEGVKIGFVESFRENENQTSFDVEVRLAADMTKISNVLVIRNNDYYEAIELEDEVKKRDN